MDGHPLILALDCMVASRLFILFTAVALYASSLFAPVFQCHRQSPLGYEVLSYGWAGLFLLDPRWYANVGFALVLAKSLFGSDYRPSVRTVSLLVGSSVAMLLPVPGGCPETDHMSPALGLRYGVLLWVGSLCVLAALRLVPNVKHRAAHLNFALNVMIQETSQAMPEGFPLRPVDHAGHQLMVGDSVTVLSVASCARGLPDEDQRQLQSIVGKGRKIIEFDSHGFVWLSFTNEGSSPDFCLFPSEVART